MRRILLCGLSLLAAGTLSCSAATVGGTTPKKPAGKLAKLTQRQKSLESLTKYWNNGGVKHAAPVAGNDPVATMTSTGGWGQLEGEDGTTWYYTTTLTSSNYYYSGCSVTIYDNKHQQAAQFSVQLPEGKSINSISPYGTITSKFFDRDANTKEVLVGLHAVGDASNSYQGQYFTQVYHLDGTLANTYEGNGVQVNIEQNSWTKYQRLILVNDSSASTGNVDEFGYEETKDYEVYDILKPASWGSDAPTVEHQFLVDLDLTYYSNGQPFNIYTVGTTPYYAIAKYEKPYVSGYDSETWDPIVTEGNSYNVVVYDQKFKQVDSLSVPFTIPSDALYRMPGFGEMSTHDLSKGFFSTDDKFDYVITFEDYITSEDDYRYDFEVFNSTDGNTKSICTDVYSTWGQLKDIEGQEEQWYFMQQYGTVQQVQTVDLPSCTKVTTFPATISGELISTSLNRYPVDDGYKYIMKLGQGTSDDEGNVIARLGWYNAEQTATLDHYVSFNLGPDAENFSANLQSSVLNPYLFNTTDELEYFYIAKVKDTSTGRLDNYLFVADSEGNVIKQFDYEETKGDLYTAILNTSDAKNPELEVIYKDDNDKYSFDFYSLPFSKFQGGDGTKDNPYLVATAGDLLQVDKEPEASYKQVADIDMDAYNGSWTPLDGFSGTYEGDGHSISNLKLNSSESTAGLFGSMENGATVANLTFVKPVVTLTSNNQYVGVLAGSCIGDSINNVHVFDAQITGDATSAVGGLVGEASYYSQILSSSFNGTITASSASPVGGIAGQTRTSTVLEAVAASGDYTAGSSLGGIVGTTSTACTVNNAHNTANLTAGNTVGGIVGSNDSRARISNSLAEGKFTANHLDYPSWQTYSVGGIVGSLASNWAGGKDSAVVACAVSADLVATTDDGTVHRIAGYTIANEEGSKKTDAGLVNNHAAATTTINGTSVSSTSATSVQGANAETLDTDFFTTLGYAFGQTTAEPWLATKGLPVLYFEDAALALTLDKESLIVGKDQSAELTVTVYGTTADLVDFSSSDETVATVDQTSIDGQTAVLTVNGVKEGTSTVTVTVGTLTATCTVTVVSSTAIDAATADGQSLRIVPAEGSIRAEGATSLTVYSTSGETVAATSSQSVSTQSLTKGIYLVVATGAQGKQTAAKVVVK